MANLEEIIEKLRKIAPSNVLILAGVGLALLGLAEVVQIKPLPGSEPFLRGLGGFLATAGILLYPKSTKLWLWLLPFIVAGILFSIPVSSVPSSPVPISTECRFNNLLKCSVPVPVVEGGSQLTTSMVSGALVADFTNNQNFSGIAFQFNPALDVRDFTSVELRGTSTQTITFLLEYKVRIGGRVEIVASSAYQSFPNSSATQTINVPLTYAGTINEIVISFYVKGESSRLVIESIYLSK